MSFLTRDGLDCILGNGAQALFDSLVEEKETKIKTAQEVERLKTFELKEAPSDKYKHREKCQRHCQVWYGFKEKAFFQCNHRLDYVSRYWCKECGQSEEQMHHSECKEYASIDWLPCCQNLRYFGHKDVCYLSDVPKCLSCQAPLSVGLNYNGKKCTDPRHVNAITKIRAIMFPI